MLCAFILDFPENKGLMRNAAKNEFINLDLKGSTIVGIGTLILNDNNLVSQ